MSGSKESGHRGRGIRVAGVAWPEVEERLRAGALAVLPIGASSKAHGRHLPMDTDFRQAEWLANELVSRSDVVVWPTLGYGHYPAFIDYPGSCSIRASTFRAVVADILEGILRAGAGRVLILNTGISTIDPVRQALDEGPERGSRTKLVNVYEGERFRIAESRLAQQRRGGHADEIETSIMLAIAPQTVDMGRAEPWDSRPIRGVFSRLDPRAPNYSPDGVYGDPSLATAEKGEILLEAMLRDILDAVQDM